MHFLKQLMSVKAVSYTHLDVYKRQGITYADQDILYAARGFGEKKTDGYHVEVTACYETEDTIYVTTELRGPQKGEDIKKEKNCPYVVIKMDYEEKQVMFL